MHISWNCVGDAAFVLFNRFLKTKDSRGSPLIAYGSESENTSCAHLKASMALSCQPCSAASSWISRNCLHTTQIALTLSNLGVPDSRATLWISTMRLGCLNWWLRRINVLQSNSQLASIEPKAFYVGINCIERRYRGIKAVRLDNAYPRDQTISLVEKLSCLGLWVNCLGIREDSKVSRTKPQVRAHLNHFHFKTYSIARIIVYDAARHFQRMWTKKLLPRTE